MLAPRACGAAATCHWDSRKGRREVAAAGKRVSPQKWSHVVQLTTRVTLAMPQSELGPAPPTEADPDLCGRTDTPGTSLSQTGPCCEQCRAGATEARWVRRDSAGRGESSSVQAGAGRAAGPSSLPCSAHWERRQGDSGSPRDEPTPAVRSVRPRRTADFQRFHTKPLKQVRVLLLPKGAKGSVNSHRTESFRARTRPPATCAAGGRGPGKGQAGVGTLLADSPLSPLHRGHDRCGGAERRRVCGSSSCCMHLLHV